MVFIKNLLKYCAFIVVLNFSFIVKAYTVETFEDSSRNQAHLNKAINLQNYYSDVLKDKEMKILSKDYDFKLINAKENFIILLCIVYIILQVLIFYIIYYWQNRIVKSSAENMEIQQNLIYYQQNEYRRILNAINYQDLMFSKIKSAPYLQIIENGIGGRNNNCIMEINSINIEENIIDKIDNVENIILGNELNYEQENSFDDSGVYINDISPAFINWLTDTYYNFSTDEIQLCILLRMGLTTKEIGNITFQSSKEISSMEIQLRKRLNINNPILSLSSFLYHRYLESKIGEVLIMV